MSERRVAGALSEERGGADCLSASATPLCTAVWCISPQSRLCNTSGSAPAPCRCSRHCPAFSSPPVPDPIPGPAAPPSFPPALPTTLQLAMVLTKTNVATRVWTAKVEGALGVTPPLCPAALSVLTPPCKLRQRPRPALREEQPPRGLDGRHTQTSGRRTEGQVQVAVLQRGWLQTFATRLCCSLGLSHHSCRLDRRSHRRLPPALASGARFMLAMDRKKCYDRALAVREPSHARFSPTSGRSHLRQCRLSRSTLRIQVCRFS